MTPTEHASLDALHKAIANALKDWSIWRSRSRPLISCGHGNAPDIHIRLEDGLWSWGGTTWAAGDVAGVRTAVVREAGRRQAAAFAKTTNDEPNRESK